MKLSRHILFATTIALAGMSFSSSSLACVWQLNSDDAELHFVSVKNDTIAELYRFTTVNGHWAGDQAKIDIPISGLDTLIPIRNERMAKYLFQAEQHANIIASATVPASLSDSLKVGTSIQQTIPLQITIAGKAAQVDAAVTLTRLSEREILVQTYQPVLINSHAFGLNSGIDTLRDIAGLQRIDYVVPVTFSVTFQRAG